MPYTTAYISGDAWLNTLIAMSSTIPEGRILLLAPTYRQVCDAGILLCRVGEMQQISKHSTKAGGTGCVVDLEDMTMYPGRGSRYHAVFLYGFDLLSDGFREAVRATRDVSNHRFICT